MAADHTVVNRRELPGILGDPLRTATAHLPSSARHLLYSDDELVRARLIRAMKPTDLTIEDLRELADLVDEMKALRELPPVDASRAEAIQRLEWFISRIRTRCEVLRGRIDEAEAAAVQLEALIEAAQSPD